MGNLSQASRGSRRDASQGLVLAIVCSGVVLAALDLFIVNVALPQMARDFGVRGGELADLSWVLNAYAIAYAALLVVFGRLAERYPRERGFLLGIAVFVAGSAACGAATSVAMLVAFRVVQAAGAALLTPTSLGLILATSAPERRQGAIRTWTAVGGLAAAAGPVVGGLLVAANWRWVFLVNVPIGLLALAIGWRRLPRVPGHPVPAPDALGALLITGGVAALVLALVEGSGWGWGDSRTVAALSAAVVAIALFALHCLQHRNPLIDRALLRLRPFTGASAVLIVFNMAFGAMLLSRVLWAQDVWHWSPIATGLAIAPGPLMVPPVAFFLAGRLTARLGPGPVTAAGSALFAVGCAWWAAAMELRPDYVGDMLGGMVLTGIGVGLVLPTLTATGASALPPHAFATGSAVLNLLRQLGLAIGVALLIAILGTPDTPARTLRVYQEASWVIAALALAGGLTAMAILARGREPLPKAVAAVTTTSNA
jgi:EmrB/QacA subfamily drug resistance transporter